MLQTRHRARTPSVAGGELPGDGELTLVVAADGHLGPVEPFEVEVDAPDEPRPAAEREVVSADEAALIAANQLRISALHEQRYGGINSFGDLVVSIVWSTMPRRSRPDHRPQLPPRTSAERPAGARGRRRGSLVSSLRLLTRMRRRLDAVTVDDAALEDELEPLYKHGNRLFRGGGR